MDRSALRSWHRSCMLAGMARLDRALQAQLPDPWVVYAITGPDGVPVYVGATGRPRQRGLTHLGGYAVPDLRELGYWTAGRQATCIEVLDRFPTRRMMLAAEREYQAYLRPRFNAPRNPVDIWPHYIL